MPSQNEMEWIIELDIIYNCVLKLVFLKPNQQLQYNPKFLIKVRLIYSSILSTGDCFIRVYWSL